MQQRNHFRYIDALRGYAVLMVIAVHTSQMVSGLGGPSTTLLNAGARGVQLFFVCSALTLMMSWHSRTDSTSNFYMRRIFRIAPVYWIALLGFSLSHHLTSREHFFDYAAMHAVLIHGLHAGAFVSIVPGGWSVGVEMLFYLIFPLIVTYLTDWKRALFAFLFFALFAQYAVLNLSKLAFNGVAFSDVYTWADLGLIAQLPVFLAGVVSYFAIRSRFQPSRCAINALLAIAIVAALSLAYLPLPSFRSYSCFAVCFAVAVYALSKGAGRWAVNPVVVLVGRVSFSAYLLHFVAMDYFHLVFRAAPLDLGLPSFALTFLIITLSTLPLAWLSYRLIELPMIRWGARLIDGRIIALYRPAQDAKPS